MENGNAGASWGERRGLDLDAGYTLDLSFLGLTPGEFRVGKGNLFFELMFLVAYNVVLIPFFFSR